MICVYCSSLDVMDLWRIVDLDKLCCLQLCRISGVQLEYFLILYSEPVCLSIICCFLQVFGVGLGFIILKVMHIIFDFHFLLLLCINNLSILHTLSSGSDACCKFLCSLL